MIEDKINKLLDRNLTNLPSKYRFIQNEVNKLKLDRIELTKSIDARIEKKEKQLADVARAITMFKL